MLKCTFSTTAVDERINFFCVEALFKKGIGFLLQTMVLYVNTNTLDGISLFIILMSSYFTGRNRVYEAEDLQILLLRKDWTSSSFTCPLLDQ